MAYGVKGAGSSKSGENPKVTSKFDRMHGHPRVPGGVSKPGGTAPIGSGHSGGAKAHINAESGHMQPRESSPARTEHKVTHHAPHTLGTSMADGHREGGDKNWGETDIVGGK